MLGKELQLNVASCVPALRSVARIPWGLVDQGVISLANFGSAVIIARALGPTLFGAFALIFSFLMLAANIQAATVCQPHNVRAAALDQWEYRNLSVSSALQQGLFSIATVLLILPALLIMESREIRLEATVPLVVITFLAYQWQEFFRRILYTEGRTLAATLNDLVSYGGQALLVGSLWLSGALDSLQTALWVVAATSALAALLGALQTRPSFRSGRVTREHLAANWRFGRWLGGAAAIGWLSSQMLVVVAAAALGASVVGLIKATELALRPLAVMLNYFDTILPVRFSRILASHPVSRFSSEVYRTSRRVLLPIALYIILFALAGPHVLTVAFGYNYDGYSLLPALFGIYFLLMSATRIVSSALKALQQGFAVFRAALLALAVSAPAAWLFIQEMGVYGVMFGLVFTAAVTLAGLLRMYRTTVQQPVAPERQAAAREVHPA